jgi:DNA modification methylase
MNRKKHETSIDQTGKNVADLHILCGDSLTELRKLPAESIHCVVTSPPYYKLRDYGVAGQIGQEQTVDEYVSVLQALFAEVRRVLREDGTLWLNLGDSAVRKNKLLIPARVAMALQADEWILRDEIVWAKRTPMPESVRDRPTNSWEPIFLFSKSRTYFYDAVAVAEPSVGPKNTRPFGKTGNSDRNDQGRTYTFSSTRNLRNVWTLSPEFYSGGHFAPFPTEIPRRAILAGTSEKGCCPVCGSPWRRIVEKKRTPGVYGGLRKRADAPGAVTSPSSIFRTGDAVETVTVGWEPTCQCGRTDTVPCTVLDPFGGCGTTGKVALTLGRKAILIELNPAYCELIRGRCEA